MQSLPHVDVCIAGAGIIGLSLAMELQRRGLKVLVLEQGRAMHEASWAAAGMLSALDPNNPAELMPLSRLSLDLYPAYLGRIAELSGKQIPIRTNTTLLAVGEGNRDQKKGTGAKHRALTRAELKRLTPALDPGASRWIALEEPSLDPRDLCAALPAATQSLGIEMREETAWLSTSVQQNQPQPARSLLIETSAGTVEANTMVHCTGAWAATAMQYFDGFSADSLRPRKGQAVCVRLPVDCVLPCAVHGPDCYIVPRGDGRAIIGATVEDCGFDKSVDDAMVQDLLARAGRLVPAVGRATVLESWAGLRPGSPDGLPVMGGISGAPGSYIAAGHYRMGILLAPATARLMAQLVLGEEPEIDLAAFTPQRLGSFTRQKSASQAI
jgi:glycine oxidase